MRSRGIFLLCWKQQQQHWYFEKVSNHTLHNASAQTNQHMQYRDSIYMPLNLHTCEAAVTFMDHSWFPHLQVALCGCLLQLQHVSPCFMLLVQFVQQWISVWWTSMDQWLHFFPVVFQPPTILIQNEVKPEGNQVPLVLPHISESWSNKHKCSMMNRIQYESHHDLMYRFLHDWALFWCPCVAGGTWRPWAQ